MYIEEVFQEVRIRYQLHKNKCSVTFKVVEIVAYTHPENEELYEQRNAQSSLDTTPSFNDAQRFIEGFVKWDGCSHYNFGTSNGYIHLCGKNCIMQISDIIKHVYLRSGQIMKEVGTYLMEGEFEDGKVSKEV